MPARWYVYRVQIGSELAYIGKGTANRFLTSARRLGGIAGILEFFERERSALKRERELIALHRPRLNKTAGGEGRSKTRRSSDAAIERRWREEAYAKETSGWWLDKLAAICFRKCEGIAPSMDERKWLMNLKNAPMHNAAGLMLRVPIAAS